ncbi:MAG: CBS domain-containing protein [Amphritea sp.]
MVLVKDIMSENILALRANMSLVQALDHLLESGMIGLPVVDDSKRVIGFLSEHDCIPHLLDGSYHCDSHVLVKDMMHIKPLAISPGDSILELAQMMVGVKPKVYPVVEDDKLVGIISRSQVMASLNKQLKECRVA